MGKVAFVFPGQASQYPGMGRELAEKYVVARAVFEVFFRRLLRFRNGDVGGCEEWRRETHEEPGCDDQC